MLVGGERRPAAVRRRRRDHLAVGRPRRRHRAARRVADCEAAVAAAVHGAALWRRTPAHERLRILLRAADLADERAPAVAA